MDYQLCAPQMTGGTRMEAGLLLLLFLFCYFCHYCWIHGPFISYCTLTPFPFLFSSQCRHRPPLLLSCLKLPSHSCSSLSYHFIPWNSWILLRTSLRFIDWAYNSGSLSIVELLALLGYLIYSSWYPFCFSCIFQIFNFFWATLRGPFPHLELSTMPH